jgi:hypothetical protein
VPSTFWVVNILSLLLRGEEEEGGKLGVGGGER